MLNGSGRVSREVTLYLKLSFLEQPHDGFVNAEQRFTFLAILIRKLGYLFNE